jgi:hypothetical protein
MRADDQEANPAGDKCREQVAKVDDHVAEVWSRREVTTIGIVFRV